MTTNASSHFNFVRGITNKFEKNDSFPSTAVSRNGVELMKDIYTCNDFHMEVFFQYDGKGKATVIDTMHIPTTHFIPLDLKIQRATDGKPKVITIKLETASGYSNYVLDFLY